MSCPFITIIVHIGIHTIFILEIDGLSLAPPPKLALKFPDSNIHWYSITLRVGTELDLQIYYQGWNNHGQGVIFQSSCDRRWGGVRPNSLLQQTVIGKLQIDKSVWLYR